MEKKDTKDRLIAIFALIISAISMYVSIRSSTIANLQAEIARNSALPMIEIAERLEDADGYNWNKHCVIEIRNLSGRMNNYQSSVISFLRCGYFDENDPSYKTVDIPMVSYYTYSVRYNTTDGLIEKKYTADNFERFIALYQAALQPNSNEDNSAEVNNLDIVTYIRIQYLDLLGDKQEEYYLLGSPTAGLIDSAVGADVYNEYERLQAMGFSINPNRPDEFTLETIAKTAEEMLEIGEVVSEKGIKQEMRRENMKLDSVLIAAFISSSATLVGVLVNYWCEKKSKQKFSATILLNDLKSIERYLKEEKEDVNLRYSDSWQGAVANCPFLKGNEVEWIYLLYGLAYNYNFEFNRSLESNKCNLPEYFEMKRMLFKEKDGCLDYDEYTELYKNMQNKLKRKG